MNLSKKDSDLDEIFEEKLDDRRSCGFSDLEIKNCIEIEMSIKRKKRINNLFLGLTPALNRRLRAKNLVASIKEEINDSLSNDLSSEYTNK